MNPANKFLSSTKIDWPNEFLDLLKQHAGEEDENVSSLVRKVMAGYVGWKGPTRNIRDYRPKGLAA